MGTVTVDIYEYLSQEDICDLETDEFGFTEESCARTIERDDSPSIHPVSPIPGLEAKYTDFYVSMNRQTFYALQEGNFVEIPRSEWMSEEQYRNWLSEARET